MSDVKRQYLMAANIVQGSYYSISGTNVAAKGGTSYRRWAAISDLSAGTYTFSMLALPYTVLRYADGTLHTLSELATDASGETIEVPQDYTLYPSATSVYSYTVSMFVDGDTLPEAYVEGIFEGEEEEDPEETRTSILNSVKAGIGGIPEEYTVFDDTLIVHINGVLQRFYQMRIGPIDKPFKITGADETWEEFLGAETSVSADMEMVKSDMILRVRLLFDSPSSSYAVDNIQKMIQEYEWCMNTQVDSEDTYTEDEDDS